MRTNFTSDVTCYNQDETESNATVTWSIEAEEADNGLSQMVPVVSKVLIDGVEWPRVQDIGWELEAVSRKGVSFRLAYINRHGNDLTLCFGY